jgi:hypothetical protein
MIQRWQCLNFIDHTHKGGTPPNPAGGHPQTPYYRDPRKNKGLLWDLVVRGFGGVSPLGKMNPIKSDLNHITVDHSFIMNQTMKTQQAALKTTLQACRVATLVHQMYDAEASKGDPKFKNWYHGHYSLSCGFRTSRPDLLIAVSYYGIPVSKIITPMGTLHCSGSGSSSQNMTVENLDFDMVLIKEGYQSSHGFHGPWYQITRVGDVHFPLLPYEESTPVPWEEMEANRAVLSEYAYRLRIHTDRLGLSERLLAGQAVTAQDFVTNNQNEHLHKYLHKYTRDRVKDFDQSFLQGTIRWDLWWKIIYATHNNA